AILNEGAVTFGNGALAGGATGAITTANSVLGAQPLDLNVARGTKADIGTIIISRYDRQIVTIFHTDTTAPVFAPYPSVVTADAAHSLTVRRSSSRWPAAEAWSRTRPRRR